MHTSQVLDRLFKSCYCILFGNLLVTDQTKQRDRPSVFGMKFFFFHSSFQHIYSLHYGPKYDKALQSLVWEFLSRLETFTPVPSFHQVSRSLEGIALFYSLSKFHCDSLTAARNGLERIHAKHSNLI